jgi:hypothetical protein
MNFKLGDKINSIEEMLHSWAEDPGRWYVSVGGFKFTIVLWVTPKSPHCKKQDGNEYILGGFIAPYTIIADPAVGSDDARICREHWIEVGQWWAAKKTCITVEFGALCNIVSGNGTVEIFLTRKYSDKLKFTEEHSMSPAFIFEYFTRIDPVKYINSRVYEIYARSTRETAVADTHEKFTLLDRALEIGMIKHGEFDLETKNCPLCKAHGRTDVIMVTCKKCSIEDEGHACCAQYAAYIKNKTPDTWRALYERIMSVESLEKPDARPKVKPGQVWNRAGYQSHQYVVEFGSGELHTILIGRNECFNSMSTEETLAGLDLTDLRVSLIKPTQIIVDRKEWEACQCAKKAFDGGKQ